MPGEGVFTSVLYPIHGVLVIPAPHTPVLVQVLLQIEESLEGNTVIRNGILLWQVWHVDPELDVS